MKRVPLFLLGLFPAVFAVAPSACTVDSALGRDAICVELPERPSSWAVLPDLEWRLNWRGSDGALRESLVSGGSVSIEVGRGLSQAILAYPESAGRILDPAGALYPADLNGSRLSLGWMRGWEAEVYRLLEREGLSPETVNFPRLDRELTSRSVDPWLMSPLEAARRLASASFKATALESPRLFPVAIPGPGPWAPESPLCPAPEASQDGQGFSSMLPSGCFIFFGATERLCVSVDSGGRALIIRK